MPEDATIRVPVARAKATGIQPTVNTGFDTEDIEKYWDDGKYTLALITLSIRMENILTLKVIEETGLSENHAEAILDEATLGQLNDYFGEEKIDPFGSDLSKSKVYDLVEYRNLAAHYSFDHGGNLDESLENDDELKSEVWEIVEWSIEFIDSL